jgi:tRNA threonylcarbamoyladenosine biosynthesis protein TsaB
MITLTIRTDKPEAELGLYKDTEQLAYLTWEAHRQLAETIHQKIKDLLAGQNLALKDLNAVVAYKGPGSFTGLRIGLSVANAIADSLKVPITTETDPNWIKAGIKKLEAGQNIQIVLPEYGAPVHVTLPKK